MKLELTEDETRILVAVLDAGVKAAGLQAVRALAPILGKIDAAIAEAQKHGEPELQRDE